MPIAPLVRALFVCLLLTSTGTAWAQQSLPTAEPPAVSNWLLYQSDARLRGKWGVHLEGQLRRGQERTEPRRSLALLAANYYATPQFVLTTGYGYALSAWPDNLPDHAARLPEHRLYEQLLVRDTEGRVRVQHRYRLEQRWLQTLAEPTFRYVNRLRYQLSVTLPLHGQAVVPGGLYATASDELFFNFGHHAPSVFDQNRAALALGYQVSAATALEVGYLNQLLPTPGSYSGMDQHYILQLRVAFNPDLRPAALAGR